MRLSKEDFISYRNSERFPNSVFSDYYFDKTTEELDIHMFNMYTTTQMFVDGNYLTNVINVTIIPFYTREYKLYGKLLDQEGNLIRYIDEITKED